MKRLITLLLLTFSLNVYAENICPNLKSEIEPDHQFKESDFTKENAQAAIKFFSEVINSGKTYQWYEPPHHQAMIKGYILKQSALKEMAAKNSMPSDFYRPEFCIWLSITAIID